MFNFFIRWVEQFDTRVKVIAQQARGLLQTRYGLWFVGFISYVESALPVPLITDPFLIVYILANRGKAVAGVLVTTAMSVAGGVTAFAVAAYFQSLVVTRLSPHTLAQFETIVARFQEEMFVVTILGAVTPVPYTLVGFAAGFVEGSLLIFVIASIVGRGARYALVGFVTHRFGIRAMEKLREQITLLTLVTVLLVGLYVFIKLSWWANV